MMPVVELHKSGLVHEVLKSLLPKLFHITLHFFYRLFDSFDILLQFILQINFLYHFPAWPENLIYINVFTVIIFIRIMKIFIPVVNPICWGKDGSYRTFGFNGDFSSFITGQRSNMSYVKARK